MKRTRRPKLPKEVLDRRELAAIAAGYSPKNARRTAARKLRDPRILAYMEKLEREEKEGIGVDENSAAG